MKRVKAGSRRAAVRHKFGAVPRISRTCGGAAPPAAMPHRVDRIQFYRCGAALGGGSYARASHVDSTNRRILQKYYKIMCRFLSGNPIQARRKLLWIEGAGAKDYMGVVVKVWPHMSYKCALNELAGSHYTLQDKEIPAYL